MGLLSSGGTVGRVYFGKRVFRGGGTVGWATMWWG
jgi:hypothetical protein